MHDEYSFLYLSGWVVSVQIVTQMEFYIDTTLLISCRMTILASLNSEHAMLHLGFYGHIESSSLPSQSPASQPVCRLLLGSQGGWTRRKMEILQQPTLF